MAFGPAIQERKDSTWEFRIIVAVLFAEHLH